MNRIIFENAKIYDTASRSFRTGELTVCDGFIVMNGGISGRDAEHINLGGAYVIPGMVDVHTHGRSGFESTEVDAGDMIKMARTYAKAGTTSFFPTMMSVPFDRLEAGIDAAAGAMKMQAGGMDGARVIGVHLEGRYLNVKKKGAHNPDYLKPLDQNELSGLVKRFASQGGKRFHLTCAPELSNGENFVKSAVAEGVTVSIGHSNATAEECEKALGWGVTGFTHLYNAMSAMSHREPGCVGVGLASDAYCELICDGRHIDPVVVRATYRAKGSDKLVLITDSAPSAGLPEGRYTMGGAEILVGNGAAYLLDGTLTGSIIDLYTGMRNLAKFAGIPIEDAIPCATINPAKMVGADDEVGSLEFGRRADFIVADENYDIKQVYVGGKIVE